MERLPELGVGLSYRPKWRQEVLSGMGRFGCVEIIAEDYFECPDEKLRELDSLCAAFPVIPHGLAASIGTDAPLREAHLRQTALLVERVQAPWFTEHLAFTGVPGASIGHLAPLPFTREAVAVVCRNVKRWREAVGVPLLLENVAYLVAWPGGLTEAQFVAEVLEQADCGLLLDLHNLYANALNHRYDPFGFLESLPLHRVGQVHLAGGHDANGYRIDSHSAPVPGPVWDLFRWVVARVNVKAVVVEWDENLPTFDGICYEVEQARRIWCGEADDAA